jgi:hypothetical protein
MGPILGATADRHGPPRVLLPAAAGQAALLLALVAMVARGAPNGLVVATAGLAGALLPPTSACMRALWPVVMSRRPEALGAAYALDATTQELLWITGPAVVAVLVLVASPGAAVALAALLTIAGVIVFARAPAVRLWPLAERGRRARLGALASPPIRALTLTLLSLGSWHRRA